MGHAKNSVARYWKTQSGQSFECDFHYIGRYSWQGKALNIILSFNYLKFSFKSMHL